VPRRELAVLQVPEYLKDNYNSFFLNLFSLTIDGETFDDAGKYYLVPGPHDISVRCGLMAPSGSATYVAESGSWHFFAMETSGFGSMQTYDFRIIPKVP